MATKIILKPFDEMDWNCFMGAEGDEPLIAYIDKDSQPNHITVDGVEYQAVIICDDNGLHVDCIDKDDEHQFTWQLDTSFETAKFIITDTTLFDQPTTTGRLKSLHFYVA